MLNATHSAPLGSSDDYAIRQIARHLAHAMQHAQTGRAINGMRALLTATDAVWTLEDSSTRLRAFELCRYAELAFEAHQFARWAELSGRESAKESASHV